MNEQAYERANEQVSEQAIASAIEQAIGWTNQQQAGEKERMEIKPNIGKLAILRGTYRVTNIWTDGNINFLLCFKGHCPLLGPLAKREKKNE